MTNNYNPDPAYGQQPQGVRLPPPPQQTQPQADDHDVAIARRALQLEKEGTEKAKWGALGCVASVAIVIWALATRHHGVVPAAGAGFFVGAYMVFLGGKLATEAEELADQIQDEPLVSQTNEFVTLPDGRVVSREHAESLAASDAARVREGYSPIHTVNEPAAPAAQHNSEFDDLGDEEGF